MTSNYADQHEAELFKHQIAQVSDTDLAWFAAWLSADGYIRVDIKRPYNANRTPFAEITFGITDRDPLDRFVELFGGAVSKPRTQKKTAKTVVHPTKPTYWWHLSGMKAVILLERCMPWLSLRYQERAKLAVQYKHAVIPLSARGPSLAVRNLSAFAPGFLTNLHPDEL